jgi:broad specificity phosphatase PhoE
MGPNPPGTRSTSPSPTFEAVPATSRQLLLVRHGQSEWNALGRWQGQADPDLSALGREQAGDAARRLAGMEFAAVISSDLRRARATADILAGALGLPVGVDPDLREIDVGDWQGLTRAEIEAGWPGALADWSAGRSESPPGGESRAHLVDRARVALARAAAAASPGDRLLVVSHGALIRHLDRVLGLEPEPVANLGGRWYRADGAGSLEPGPPVALADPEDRTLSPSG